MLRIAATFGLCFFIISAAGCGDASKKEGRFFTSGNHEADQRADQTMAKAEQLKNGQGSSTSPSDAKKTLYDRLGGQAGETAIVDDFVNRAIDDPRVNFARKGVTQGGVSIHRGQSEEWNASGMNVKLLKLHFTQFLALATGGPSEYQGKQMTEAHQNMHISNAEFDASVGDLKATLDKQNIATQDQKELLSIIESTRPQVVEER